MYIVVGIYRKLYYVLLIDKGLHSGDLAAQDKGVDVVCAYNKLDWQLNFHIRSKTKKNLSGH